MKKERIRELELRDAWKNELNSAIEAKRDKADKEREYEIMQLNMIKNRSVAQEERLGRLHHLEEKKKQQFRQELINQIANDAQRKALQEMEDNAYVFVDDSDEIRR